MPTSNFQPIRLLDPDHCYKFTYLMANSADPDQLASEEANWSGSTHLQRQGISRFSRTRVKISIPTRMRENIPSDMWAQLRFKSVHTLVFMKIFCILGYPKCTQWLFWSDCTNAQVDLNLCWVHKLEGRFCVGAQFYLPPTTVCIPNCLCNSLILLTLNELCREKRIIWDNYEH